MCVIFVADTERPTSDELEKANLANGDGIGVAWHDKEKGFVRWMKGLDLKAAQEMAADLPMPYAIHFRLASIGPKVDQLTHPFPIEYKVRLDLMGRTDRGVIMHNGSWFAWDKNLPKGIQKKGVWSDSRAIAWLLARARSREAFDELLMRHIPGKFAYVHGTGIATYGEFDKVREGLSASNLYWRHYGRHTASHYKAEEARAEASKTNLEAWLKARSVLNGPAANDMEREVKEGDPNWRRVDGVWRPKPKQDSVPVTNLGGDMVQLRRPDQPMEEFLKTRGYVQDAHGVWRSPDRHIPPVLESGAESMKCQPHEGPPRIGYKGGSLHLLPSYSAEGDVQRARRVAGEMIEARRKRDEALALAASVAGTNSAGLPPLPDEDVTELGSGLSVVARAATAEHCPDCFATIEELMDEGHDEHCVFWQVPENLDTQAAAAIERDQDPVCNGCGESVAGVIRHKRDCPHIGLGLEDMRAQAAAMDQSLPKGVLIDPESGQVIDAFESWDEEHVVLGGGD